MKDEIDETYVQPPHDEVALKHEAFGKPPLPPSVVGGGSASQNAHANNSNITITLSSSEGMLEEGRVVTVRDLLKGLYEKACQQKLWGLVRHTAGMLGKRVEDLAKAVTDLLVRQKQVTVGMPPNNEYTITAPLPEADLRQLIHDVSNTCLKCYI